ncbi:hypothetical protein DACRYDRAFT_116460 [Dacryopinax primogenitus]|uniref:Uncharacterized protein n=1 Tax=Dacryopinax primogenitus (strain DJM 731) TaxID=1858805 RepID=M5FU72_DACPD|nr:uncharacterized protein DACRYDRAFT_116460 [Dacryopinax primogenitus]EJU01246.1 hypothetical protein DACRYDRAFT_116460 [Dacryopinax primogenitus]
MSWTTVFEDGGSVCSARASLRDLPNIVPYADVSRRESTALHRSWETILEDGGYLASITSSIASGSLRRVVRPYPSLLFIADMSSMEKEPEEERRASLDTVYESGGEVGSPKLARPASLLPETPT